MPLHRISNHATSAVTSYDDNGRPFTVPGRTKEGPGVKSHVDISGKTLTRLLRVRGVQVQAHVIGGTGFETVEAKNSAPAPEHADTETTTETGTETETETETTHHENVTDKSKRQQADILLKAYRDEGMLYHDFVAGAKALLGDEWPGGTPKKSIVLSLLENIQE